MKEFNYRVSKPSSNILIEPFFNFESICESYGLYGKIINYQNDASVLGSGIYAVVSSEPIADDIKAFKLVNRNIRNPNIFFPHNFALELTPENGMVVLDSVMDFCKDAEFVHSLYGEYNTEVPVCIRKSELAGLKNWCEGRDNEAAGLKFREDCKDGLKTFFSKENSKFKQKIEKRKFFRTERYDMKASSFQIREDFKNRKSPIVRLPVLLQGSSEIKKVKIEKSIYERFCNYLAKCFPEVLIAVSDKEVIDLGLIDLSKKLGPDHPLLVQKPITNEEFDKIIEDNFAEMGYSCIEGVQPTQWEFRDIYYKAVDEPQVILAFNALFLSYAKSIDIFQLEERGPVDMIDMPVNDFLYFVALAKKNNLKFHIDLSGRFSVPSFNDIHVVYNSCDQKIMDEILDDMIEYNVLDSHIVSRNYLEKSLSNKIGNAQKQTENQENIYLGNKEHDRL